MTTPSGVLFEKYTKKITFCNFAEGDFLMMQCGLEYYANTYLHLPAR